MTIKFRSGSGWVTPSSIKRRQSGAWVAVSTVKRMQSGAWVQVWPVATPLAVSVDPTEAFGPLDSGVNYSDPITATASGGTGSYTYSWKKVAGNRVTIVSPTSSTTAFSYNGTITANAIFRCTVRDGISTVTSSNVTVTFE